MKEQERDKQQISAMRMAIAMHNSSLAKVVAGLPRSFNVLGIQSASAGLGLDLDNYTPTELNNHPVFAPLYRDIMDFFRNILWPHLEGVPQSFIPSMDWVSVQESKEIEFSNVVDALKELLFLFSRPKNIKELLLDCGTTEQMLQNQDNTDITPSACSFIQDVIASEIGRVS